MPESDVPVYRSRPSIKSVGNEYSIYPDRIELKVRSLLIPTLFKIYKEDILSIDIYRPPVIRTSLFALKIDLADLKEHVGIKRKNGLFKQIRFTPENPKEFVAQAEKLFEING